jgi:3-oxoacyl-(acyl-carrier-protein) synthase
MWRLTPECVGIAGVLTCQAAATHSNASQRIVITGQGIASCFGNDVDTFYEKCARIGSMATASDQHHHAWWLPSQLILTTSHLRCAGCWQELAASGRLTGLMPPASPQSLQPRFGVLTARGEWRCTSPCRVLPDSWKCKKLGHAIMLTLECMLARLVDKKNMRRYDDCLSYTLVSSKKALKQAGLDKEVRRSCTPCVVAMKWHLRQGPSDCLTAGQHVCSFVQDSPEAYEKLDKSRVGVLVGTGMGGLQVLHCFLLLQTYQSAGPSMFRTARVHGSNKSYECCIDGALACHRCSRTACRT